MNIKSGITNIFKKKEPVKQIPSCFTPFNKGRDIFPGAAIYKEHLRKTLHGGGQEK